MYSGGRGFGKEDVCLISGFILTRTRSSRKKREQRTGRGVRDP